MKLPKKSGSKKSRSPGKKSLLLGLGLDHKDGHVRMTRGENFQLIGGSKETHECMQEKAIKFNEELHRRGKRMEELSREELLDVALCAKLGQQP